MDTYLNGIMLPSGQARLSAEDAAIQHAVGLFETMSAYHGQVFRLKAHLDRLIQSADVLGMNQGLDRQNLEYAVKKSLSHNQPDRARLRLTVSPGPLSLLRDDHGKAAAAKPTVLVTAAEPIEYDPLYFEQGITVQVGPGAANPFDPVAGHKTLAYWARLRTLREAAVVGAGEVIWLNISNHLASGAISNIFLVKNEELLTPFARGDEVERALPAPVLPGITRQAIIELAETENIPVRRRMLSIHDLLQAEEVFLTNSSWQVLPVGRVEKEPVGTGKVGSITNRLRTALLDLVEHETKLESA